MQRITLAHTGITISRIGFGCASLTTHNDTAKAHAVLAAAMDAGITHFDTARMYGMGHSESILGSFIKSMRGRVTIATKFGLEANVGTLTRNRALVGAVKSVLRRSAFLNKMVRRNINTAPTAGKFTPLDAQQSLETSLRELQTDHVDFFFLHCATLEQARREDLIAYLQSCVDSGKIRAFGPSSEFAKIKPDAGAFPSAHKVLQFESDASNRNIDALANAGTRDVITFSPIFAAKQLAQVASNASYLAPIAQRAGINPTSADALAAAMLNDALARNPRGGVLFATTSPARIKANVTGALAQRTPEARAAFIELMDALVPMIQRV